MLTVNYIHKVITTLIKIKALNPPINCSVIKKRFFKKKKLPEQTEGNHTEIPLTLLTNTTMEQYPALQNLGDYRAQYFRNKFTAPVDPVEI